MYFGLVTEQCIYEFVVFTFCSPLLHSLVRSEQMRDETSGGRRRRDRHCRCSRSILFHFDDPLRTTIIEFWFDAFQKPLPKVPVPELKETLNKYLQCIKPTVSDKQYACTQKFVDEFGKTGGLGEYLQRKLIEYAESRDNWVSMEQWISLLVEW